MTTDEACDVLGVDREASPDDISSAFRRVARTSHTDTPDGDRESWDRAVEARDVLLAERPGSTLVRVDVAKELARGPSEVLERLGRRGERAAATASTLQSVTLRHTSPLVRRKRSAWMASAMAGVLGTIVTLIRTVAVSGTGDSEGAAIVLFLAGAYLASGALAVWGFVLQFRAERLTHAIEDITAQLSRRANYLQILNEIRQESWLSEEWGIDEFEQSIDEWVDATASHHPSSLAATAHEIGPRDFAELLISKGLELDVLRERTHEDGGELFVTHSVRVENVSQS